MLLSRHIVLVTQCGGRGVRSHFAREATQCCSAATQSWSHSVGQAVVRQASLRTCVHVGEKGARGRGAQPPSPCRAAPAWPAHCVCAALTAVHCAGATPRAPPLAQAEVGGEGEGGAEGGDRGRQHRQEGEWSPRQVLIRGEEGKKRIGAASGEKVGKKHQGRRGGSIISVSYGK